ncbi:MAG: ribonuclease H-like YkuK family protein [Synergistetes bacterium]|nr:ribonuclease H-like YkuK family protein [Synergistota bacterium]MDW8191783.1 ribonuclease H-like YkuK family protein [Synergistota bacterium]
MGEIFYSPTKGALTFDDMMNVIVNYISQNNGSYRLIIGTDSSEGEGETVFVTAVVLYRVGKGGIYFYRRLREESNQGFKRRIFYETHLSLDVASRISHALSKIELEEYPHLEIHLDVGPEGRTREIVASVISYVTGNGFEAKIKPDSFGATKVADKYV